MQINQLLLKFYSFSKYIFSSIYSMNLIESFNKQIKKRESVKNNFKKKNQWDAS
ncbi:transposase [Bacillus cereus group sp. BfR-BA-01381]|uniref:transposase n=1 Tax=Bacillus cereus group sp. BfR-BA-01381 TaxID=2920325 RepID=UPI0037BE8CC7